MAELVAEAFLTVAFERVFEQVFSRSGYVYDFIQRQKVDERLLRKLRVKLLLAGSLMDDGEAKQLKNQNVRKWLAVLKATMCDADDLMDEIDADALQGSNWITLILKAHDIKKKTEEIIDRLESLLQEKYYLGLVEGVPKIPWTRTPTTSLVDESGVYGRDGDKNAIVELLLSDEVSNNNKVSVIAIEGVGGIGKTTLARLFYNDDRVQNHFEIKAWVCVSDDFNIFRITKDIFESVTSRTCDISTNLNGVQENLQQALVGKKFLIVLDDVWNKNYLDWDKLKSPLLRGVRGSTILVTTRSEDIANMMRTVRSYKLEVMSEADCWSLFVKHAYLKPGAHPELEDIGRKIVNKCKGLPLAVKALGGALRNAQNPQNWNDILKSEIWEWPEEAQNVLPSLWLSYYYLPPHLKRCFSYCSIFPKDYAFEKENLIFYWMGENLLKPQKNKSIEEVGEEYFNDLLSRSLFQRDEYGRFTMHDLINDLAKYASCESCLRLDEEGLGVANTVSKAAGKATRHLSNMRPIPFDVQNLKDLCNVKILRTLILKRRFGDENQDLEVLVGSMQYLRVLEIDAEVSSLANLKLLRYLKFDGVKIEEISESVCALYSLQTLILNNFCGTKLPDKIGNLKQLRHLELTGEIEELPDTVCNLHELRTLKLVECSFVCLPDKITMLTNLCHLILDQYVLDYLSSKFVLMPPQMWKWKNLQRMPGIKLGRDTGANIKDVGELQHLQGYLIISGLENVANAEDARGANLKDKKGITTLCLGWKYKCDDSQVAQEVLDRLQPHTNLRELEIWNYGCTKFPHWVGYESFSCIKKVKLGGCNNCTKLPALGQLPSLEDLSISGFDKLEGIGNEFYYSSDAAQHASSSVITKPFKSLKCLSFSRMAEWNEWSVVEVVEGSGGAFSNLEKLELSKCPKLTSTCLPEYVPSLRELEIKECENIKDFPAKDRRLPSNIQSIKIENFQELESFSEDRWPSSLTKLHISRCEKLYAAKQWNLGMLSSLTSLVICGMEEVETFPDKEGQLPTSLTSLKLHEMRNLKSLNGKAFQRLTSLQLLVIVDCNLLQCLPEETLPFSISQLMISNCPLLEPRCQRQTGEDWSKITHISEISINNKHI